MGKFQRTVIVPASVDRVYRWWTRFEGWPTLWPALREVRRDGLHTLCWRADGPSSQPITWETAIVQDLPQRQLEWESRSGPTSFRCQLLFEALSNDRTRLTFGLIEPGDATLRSPGALVLSEGLDGALEQFTRQLEQAPMRVPLAVASPYRDLFYKGMAASAGVLLVLAVGRGLASLVEVWMILFGAVLVAATLSPAVAWLEARRWHRAAAVGVTFGALLAGIAIFFGLLIPGIMAQGQDLALRLPDYASQLQSQVNTWHAKHPAIPQDTQIMGYLATQGSLVLGNAFSLTTRLMLILVVVLSVLFLSLFLLLDGQKLQEALLRLIPIPQKSQMPALLHTTQARIGHYMLGLAVICVIAGLVTWGALASMGVPYALLIGTLTTLLQAIPFVGPLIGGGLAVAVALPKSGQLAVSTLVVYTVIQQIIGQFLFPLIMGRTLGIHPVWIAIALLIGGSLYGLVGAFLAIPVAIAISIVLECYYLPWAEAKATEGL